VDTSEQITDAVTRKVDLLTLAKPHIDELVEAGFTEQEATALGYLLATSAKVLSPLFGMTPEEYMGRRTPRYISMTQAEFDRLASAGLDGVLNNREVLAELMSRGFNPKASMTQNRKALDPMFDAVYGLVDYDSVKRVLGPEKAEEFRKAMGPKFFARKGEGYEVDDLVEKYLRNERGQDADITLKEIRDAMDALLTTNQEYFGRYGMKLYQMIAGISGAEKLAREAKRWQGAVDSITAAGRLPSNNVRMLSQTPLVLRLLGADSVTGKAAAEGGIYAAPHLFDGTHPNITPDIIKQFPEALADPIAIFDSDNPQHRANGDVVFMLDVKDANGATVVVPLAMAVRRGGGVEINLAKSAYAKENGGIPSNKWFETQVKKMPVT